MMLQPQTEPRFLDDALVIQMRLLPEIRGLFFDRAEPLLFFVHFLFDGFLEISVFERVRIGRVRVFTLTILVKRLKCGKYLGLLVLKIEDFLSKRSNEDAASDIVRFELELVLKGLNAQPAGSLHIRNGRLKNQIVPADEGAALEALGILEDHIQLRIAADVLEAGDLLFGLIRTDSTPHNQRSDRINLPVHNRKVGLSQRLHGRITPGVKILSGRSCKNLGCGIAAPIPPTALHPNVFVG